MPRKLYTNKLVFSLSTSSGSILPSTAAVIYKINDEDTEYSAIVTVDDPTFSLSNPADAFTYLNITYDRLGNYAYSNSLMSGYMANREEVSGVNSYVSSRILSAQGTDKIGSVGEQSSNSFNFYLNTSYNVHPFVDSIASSLNKGDSFAIAFSSTDNRALVTDPCYYLLMPSDYIFMNYTRPANYAAYGYTISTREITVSPEQARTYVPQGDYTLYSLTYTGDNMPGYSYHYFYFKVGPSVDTTSIRTEYLPAALAMTSDNSMFPYTTSSSYQITDTWDFDQDGDTAEKLPSPYTHPSTTINAVSAITAQAFLTSDSATGENANQSYRYNSTGSYKFYLYNGLDTGKTANDFIIDIAVPKDGTSVSYNNSLYPSTWNADMTGAPTLTGDFLTGATVSYSTDYGSTYLSDVPADYGSVTNVRITTDPALQLLSGESVNIVLPIKADFEDDIGTGSRAYFGAAMTFKTTASGDLLNTTTIEPCSMQPQNVDLSGTIYKDYNADGIQNAPETTVNKYYYLYLYRVSEETETFISSYNTDYTTGAYTIGILHPGTYKIKAIIAASEYYPAADSGSPFNENGEYTFTIGDGSPSQLTGLNLGIISPRTLSLNFSSVTVYDGTTRKIVPTISPALTGEEAVSFVSSDPAVVTVASDGTLTYAGDGSATITVTVPQLTAISEQTGETSLTATVSVTCLRHGCFTTETPTVSASTAGGPSITSDSVVYSASALKTGYYYYNFNRQNYCDAHTNTYAVTWEIIDAGTTGAAITDTDSNTSYGRMKISYTNPGAVIVRATETWPHDSSTAPDPITLTVSIIGRVEKPVVSDTLVYNGTEQTAGIAANSLYTISGNKQTNAGSYTATVSLNDTDNYTWSDGTTDNLSLSWSIGKRAITITGNSASKNYDGTELTDPGSFVSSNNLVSGHSHAATVSGSITNAASTSNIPSNAVIKDASALAVTSNYEITYEAGTLTVNKVAQEALTIVNKPSAITYGDVFSLSADGGSGSGALSWQVTSGSSATVSSGGQVTVTGIGETTITASKAADGNHTLDVTDTFTFTPSKRQLAVSAPTVVLSKVYDGTDSAAAVAGVTTNKVVTDNVTVAVSSCKYDSRTIGSGKTITISYGLSGTDAGFYIAPADETITGSISAPTVSTIVPTGIERTSAILHGSLSVPAVYIEAGFCLKQILDTDYQSYTVLSDPAAATSEFSLDVAAAEDLALEPDTEYQYKSYVKIGDITYYGTVLAFRTLKETQTVFTGSIEATLINNNPTAKDVAVSMEAGNTILASIIRTVPADSSTTVSFTGLEDGVYNIVIRSGAWTETQIINVINESSETVTFTILDGTKNTLIQVLDDAPDIAVGGMSLIFASTSADNDKGITASDLAAGNSVEIILVAQLPDDTDADTQTAMSSIETMAGVQKDNLLYVDLSLLKVVTGSGGGVSTTSLVEAPAVVEIAIPIPENMKYKENYTVYRYHGTTATRLTRLYQRQDLTDGVADVEGFYIDGANRYAFVYTQHFSVYALGYDEPTDTIYYNIGVSAGKGGRISPQSQLLVSGHNKTFTITPDEGYRIKDVLVDGISVGTANSYTFMNVTANHTIQALFTKADSILWENPFDDVKETDWFYEAVKFAVQQGLMNGTADDAFDPHASASRAALVTVLWRLEGSPVETDSVSFLDVDPGLWYSEAIVWAAKHNIVLGFSAEIFRPDSIVTREQAASILFRYASYKGYDTSAQKSLDLYEDADKISDYALNNMNWAVTSGLINGITTTTLDPTGESNRAQIAMLLFNFWENIINP